jgi:hypothetical protein
MSKRKFQVGDEIIATEKMSKYNQGRGVTPGMSGKITGYQFQGYYQAMMANGIHIQEPSTAFEKGTPKSSIDILQEQIDRAKEKIERTQAFIVEQQEKIAFMKEIGTEVFDPNEFKAYQTLTIIENSDMSKLEKAKAIASLIANK